MNIDLSVGPTAFTGPGAGDTVRALIATTLSGVHDTTPPGRVILATSEADELLGEDRATRTLPTNAIITPDLANALNTALTAAASRQDRNHDQPGAQATTISRFDTGPVVLVMNPPDHHQLTKARTAMSQLTTAGIGVLVLGEHLDANILHIDAHSTVTAVHGPAVQHLHHAALFALPVEHIGDTLHTLAAAYLTYTDHTATFATHFQCEDINSDATAGGTASPDQDPAATGSTAPHEIATEEPVSVPEVRPLVGWHDGLIRELGTRDGIPLLHDLGAFAGLGMEGPGAHAALRALWINLLRPGQPDLTPGTTGDRGTEPAARVVIPIDTADALLGAPDTSPPSSAGAAASIDSDTNTTETLARNVDGAEQVAHQRAEEEFVLGWPGEVADLDAALNELEVEILTRAREHYESPALQPTDPRPPQREPIVLITTTPHDSTSTDEPTSTLDTRDRATELDQAGESATSAPSDPHDRHRDPEEQSARLRNLSERGAPVGIAVALLGYWGPGTTCHVNAHGRITATAGPGGFALNDATLDQLDITTAREFFDQIPDHTAADNPIDSAQTSHHHSQDNQDNQDNHNNGGVQTTDDTGRSVQQDAVDTPITAVPTPPAGQPTADTDQKPILDHPPYDQIPTKEPQNTDLDEAPHPALMPTKAADTEHPNISHSGLSVAAPAAAESLQEAAPELPAPQAPARGVAGNPLALTEPTPPPDPQITLDHDSVPHDALLAIRVLGPLAVFARTAPGQPLHEITSRLSPTQRLILAALAAQTEPLHPEKLLDMCFATDTKTHETTGKDALHRLHSNLTRLRAALRQAAGHHKSVRLIANTAERYHLTDACWTDNHTLHAQLRASTRTASRGDVDTVAHWQRAFALYRGPLLAGLEYDTDPEWLLPQREHTLRTVIDLAHQLAEQLAQTNPGQAATYLNAALRLDPHNEDTASLLITYHLAHGHRHTAQRVLTQLTQDLAEIDEAPRPQTAAMLDRSSHVVPAREATRNLNGEPESRDRLTEIAHPHRPFD